MARTFLYVIAGLVALAVVLLALTALFWDELQWAAIERMKLETPYDETPLPPAPDYEQADSWLALPNAEGLAGAVPAGVEPVEAQSVDVFYIHPTSYLETAFWNAPVDLPAATRALPLYLKAQASAFNAAGRIFAPRYRQAAFGAFLAASPDTQKALATAYSDVLRAFDHYVAKHGGERPFILVGHSQGALHGLLLLRDRIAGTPLVERMVAAYLPGWPISVEEDLGALPGIAACAAPQDTGCVASWQTFAEGGDPAAIGGSFAKQTGLTGRPKAGSTMLCVNPVSWSVGGAAPASGHRGAVPSNAAEPGLGAPIPALAATRCGDDGFLYISPPPVDLFGQFLLPGGNFHVYDIALFYMDVRANARIRAGARR